MLIWKKVKNKYGPPYLLLMAKTVRLGCVIPSVIKNDTFIAKTFLPDIENKNLFVVFEGKEKECCEELIKHTLKWYDICGFQQKEINDDIK